MMKKPEVFSIIEVVVTNTCKKIPFLFLTAALCGSGYLLYRSGFFAALHSVEALQEYITSFVPFSHLCFFLIQLLSVILAPIPSNITAAAGGLLFGPLPSFLLTFAAVAAGSMLVFTLARRLGRPFTDRLVSRKISEKYLAVIRTKTDVFLLLAFLFPFFPDDILCILAGLTSIASLRFFVILLLARPWGLLFASALGGAALDLPLWSLGIFGIAGLLLFLLGIKYCDRLEARIIRRLENRKPEEKNFENF